MGEMESNSINGLLLGPALGQGARAVVRGHDRILRLN